MSIVSTVPGLLVYIGFTALTLRGAERRALRMGAFKSEKRKRDNKKKKHDEAALPQADATMTEADPASLRPREARRS